MDKGIRGFLKQMCYNMCKILKLTNATSSLDFHMLRYIFNDDGIKLANDAANILCQTLSLTQSQREIVGEKMQSLFAQNLSISLLYPLLDGSDVVDDLGMLQLHRSMTEIIRICSAAQVHLQSLRAYRRWYSGTSIN